VPVVPSVSLALKNAMHRLSERENTSLAKSLLQQVLDILLATKNRKRSWKTSQEIILFILMLLGSIKPENQSCNRLV